MMRRDPDASAPPGDLHRQPSGAWQGGGAGLSRQSSSSTPRTPRSTPRSTPLLSSGRAGQTYSYCIVFENLHATELGAAKERLRERRLVIQMIREAKLVVSKSKSCDGKEIFLRVGVREEELGRRAEELKLLKRIRAPSGEIRHEPFVQAEAARFEGFPSRLFTSNDRIRVIQFILEAPWKAGGCQIPFESLARRQVILRHFPLHDDAERAELLARVRAWNWLAEMPADTLWGIRDYFGESIAMYFAFLGFYNRWLALVALVGVVVAVVQFLDRWPPVPVPDPATGVAVMRELRSYDGPLTPFWCVFVPIAATCLCIFWSRRQGGYSLEWATWNTHHREVPRPEFRKEEERPGFYTAAMDWVDLAAPERARTFAAIRRRFPPHVWTNRFASRLAWSTRLFNYGVIAASLALCLAVLFFLLLFRAYLHAHRGPLVAASVGGLLFVLAIEGMSTLYMAVASRLTDNENHRFKSVYERSFVIKMFLFEFVNNYAVYFYIAFVKLLGVSLAGHPQRCLAVEEGAPPNCMYELSRQLGSVMLFQVVLGNVVEVLLPLASARLILLYRRLRASLGRAPPRGTPGGRGPGPGEGRPSKTEEEGSLPEPSLFEEYREMVLQFGYVVLFAAGFPLAAFLAWCNNVVEIRTDAVKLLGVQRRPRVTAARDIGSWFTVLQILTKTCIVTNVLLICFVSTTLDELFASLAVPYPRFWKLFLIVAVEHSILALKLLLEQLVQTTPRALREEIALQEILVEWEKRGLAATGKERPAASALASSLSSLSSMLAGEGEAAAGDGLGGYESPRTDEEPPSAEREEGVFGPLAAAPSRRSLFVQRGTTGVFSF